MKEILSTKLTVKLIWYTVLVYAYDVYIYTTNLKNA